MQSLGSGSSSIGRGGLAGMASQAKTVPGESAEEDWRVQPLQVHMLARRQQ
jgi:hypothetical protein